MKIIGTGYVSKVPNEGTDERNSFQISFTIKGYIEDAVAYPADLAPDEPNEGDPVLIYETESIFGYSFLYSKMRLKDHIRMKLGNSSIEIHDDQVYIHTESGNEVNISSDGAIKISSSKDIEISSASNVKVEGNHIEVKGSNIKLDGELDTTAKTVSATGSGPFCAIKVCPYTGMPHVGSVAM